MAILTKGAAFIHREIVRPAMPTLGYVKRNGVPTDQEVKPLDSYLPSSFVPRYVVEKRQSFSIPGYEDALSEGLRQHVQHGDKVIVVGGGWGVTSTIAARQVGSKGYVWVFEGSEKMTSHTRAALKINDVDRNAEVHHAIVGEGISVKQDDFQGTPTQVTPKELPECDVLELDCEGAETLILENMEICPRAILVESHGMYGAATDDVKDILRKKGYKIKHTQVADSSLESFCVENDIRVVFASR
jgi:hypothetical protein